MHQYKAVLADVDGTLIAPVAKPAPVPSQELIETVRKVEDKGVIFTLATGRSLPWVIDLVESLNIKHPLILDNGARIYDPVSGRYIVEHYLSDDQVKQALAIFGKIPNTAIYFTDGEDRISYPTDRKFQNVSKVMAVGLGSEQADAFLKELKVIPEVSLSKSVSGVNPIRNAVHVTSLRGTKQIAVLELSKILHIPTKEMIGIGDSENDLPLLLACGLKVAMGNAIESLKEIADYIAPRYDEDGVIEVLNRFILKQ